MGKKKKRSYHSCTIEKSNKLNVGRTGEKELDWNRPGLGMSCDMAGLRGGRQQALCASVSPLKHTRPRPFLCVVLTFVSGSVSPVRCSRAGPIADPEVGELNQLLVKPITVRRHHLGQHCTVCSTDIPSAC